MSKYNFVKIERKWQSKWDKSGIYKAVDFAKNPKYYCLIEFPYPSGAGLHVGHLRSHIAIDIVARKKRMDGFNVLYPIGWDAFGLPTENFAIKTKTHPKMVTKKNIKNFTKQIKSYGPSFDWSREINTTDPEYYKWTQWIFLKFFNSFYDDKHDKARPIEELEVPNGLDAIEKNRYIDSQRLAYETEMAINWCPECKIGLANEEVVDGKCERCHAPAEKKVKKQWMLRITKYAQRLIDDLGAVDYLEKIKTQQINWIGRSEGATVKFQITNDKSQTNSELQNTNNALIEVFTTRLDTIYGCTYVVLAPEHPLIATLKDRIINFKEVSKYIDEAKNKADLDRTDLAKEKTGVEIKGIKAVNPFNNEEISVWVADYVLGSYGTGAVMAVPAHDERDLHFMYKHHWAIDIKHVIKPVSFDNQSLHDYYPTFAHSAEISTLESFKNNYVKIDEDKKSLFAYTGDGILINSEKYSGLTSVEAREEMTKWLEEKGIGQRKINYKLRDWVFSRQHYWGEPIPIIKCKHCGTSGINFKIELNFRDNRVWDQIANRKKTVETRALNPDEKERYFGDIKIGDIIKFNDKNTEDFEIVKVKNIFHFKNLCDLFENKELLAKILPDCKIKTVNDLKKEYNFTPDYLEKIDKNGLIGWEFEIINITHNIAISEKYLPLELPSVKKYEPSDTGESPLINIKNWVNVKCPLCKKDVKRETDTMPNWAGSSWYFLRYLDPENEKEFVSKKNIDYWMPVDLYNGGMEHTTLHLLYSRFWHKFLFDLGYVNTKEPYKMRRSHGMILAEDGQKMSKSKGNVVNPDEVIKKYGADTIRLYEMFMGPYSEAIPWSTKSLVGMYRFLERVWNLQNKVVCGSTKPNGKKYENMILVATNNQGKLKELKDHLKGFDVISLADIKNKYKEPIESGKTYEDNSLIKAKYYAKKTGLVTVADDSGFCVNALGGKPGVLSSRFAKGDYVKAQHKILNKLFEKNDRSAYFKSAITIYYPKTESYKQFDGICRGSVSDAPRGAGGFGFDPIFIPESEVKTFGEMENAEKYKHDHRKKAVAKLIDYIESLRATERNILIVLNKTIKKVTEDVDNLKFNTAVSQLMILSNELEKMDSIPNEIMANFLRIIAPFAPHITEEIWENMGEKNSIHSEKWPTYDKMLIIENEVELVIQINGKVRDRIKVFSELSESEAKNIAFASAKIRKWIDGKEIKKILFVKGRLINIVI